MTTTFTTNKAYSLQGTGDNSGTWGVVLNNNVFTIIDLNLGGTLSLNVAGNSNITLSANQQQNLNILCTGILTGSIQVIHTASAGGLFVYDNRSTGAFTITVLPSGGSGVVIPQGSKALVMIDGTNNRAVIIGTPQVMTTTGDMIYEDTNGAQRLAVGAAGTALQGGTVPSWLPRKFKTTVALVDGATPALDASLGDVFTLTTTTNPVIGVPSNAPSTGLTQGIIIAILASGGTRSPGLNTGAGGFRFGTDIPSLPSIASGHTLYIGALYNQGASFWDVLATLTV